MSAMQVAFISIMSEANEKREASQASPFWALKLPDYRPVGALEFEGKEEVVFP